MAQDLQNSLFDAMKTMIEGFDQTGTLTIDAEIYKVINASLGKYMVKYQGATFNATAINSSLVLQEGEKVTVLIQNGDFTKEKLILTSKNLDNSNIITLYEDLTYLITSGDLINTIEEVELSSYEISNVEQNISNLPNFREIFRKLSEVQKNFVLQVDIRTDLAKEQQNALGQYGCVLAIPFINSNGEHIVKEYSIDTSNLVGAPYRLEDWAKQELIIDIPSDYIYDIDEDVKIKFFDKEFILDDTKTNIKDIFFRNAHFYSIEMLPNSAYSGYYVKVTPTQGNYFYTGLSNTKTLTAEVIYDGKKLDDSNFSCYWFKENVFIDIGDENYSYIGGVGWEGINDKQLIGTKEDGTPIYQFVPSGLTTTISSNDIITSLNYKCVIVIDDKTTVYGSTTIENLLTTVSFDLSTEDERVKYSNGANTEIKINATIFLEGVTDIATEEGLHNEITYSWSRYNRRGELIPNSLKIEYINQLVQQDNKQYYQSAVSFWSEDLIESNRIVCSALYNNTVIGTKALVLSSTAEGKYSVMIEGENALYKYDVFGNSPLKESYNAPATAKINEKNPIKAIGYRVYDEKGIELTKGGYKSIAFNWLIPINSLIESLDELDKDSDDKPIIIDNRYHVISGEGLETSALFNYTIANNFDRNKSDNTLILELNIAGEIITRSIDILFTKEGDMGTNGTTYSASIGIKEQNGDEIFDYGEKDVSGQEYKYRFVYLRNETIDNHCYCDYKGELVRWDNAPYFLPRVYESGKPLTLNSDYTVEYSLYDGKQQANDYFDIQIIDENTGECSLVINTPNEEPDMDNTFVLMAEITINLDSIADTKKKLYTFYPLEVVSMGNSNITIPGIYGGFNEVVYASDGSNPTYDGSTPFSVGFREPEIADLINGLEVDWDCTDIFNIANEQSNLNTTLPLLAGANYNTINDWITSTATTNDRVLYQLNNELFVEYNTNNDIKLIPPAETNTTIITLQPGVSSSWSDGWDAIDPTDCIRQTEYSDGTELVNDVNMPESNTTWYYNSYDHYLTHPSQRVTGQYPDTYYTHKVGEPIKSFNSAEYAMGYMNIQIVEVTSRPSDSDIQDKTLYKIPNSTSNGDGNTYYFRNLSGYVDYWWTPERCLQDMLPSSNTYVQGYNSYQITEPKYTILDNYSGFNCDQIHINGDSNTYHLHDDTVNMLYAAYNLSKNDNSTTKYFKYNDLYFKLENGKALLVTIPSTEVSGNLITIENSDLIGTYNTTSSYVNKTYKITGTDQNDLCFCATGAIGEAYAFSEATATNTIIENLYKGNNYAIKLTDTTDNTEKYLKTNYNQIWEIVAEEDVDFSGGTGTPHQSYYQEFNLTPKGKYDSVTARHYVKATISTSDINNLTAQRDSIANDLTTLQTLSNAFEDTKDTLEAIELYFNNGDPIPLQAWNETLESYVELFKTQKQAYNAIQDIKEAIEELTEFFSLLNNNTYSSTLQNILSIVEAEETKVLNSCPTTYQPADLHNMTIDTQNMPQHLQLQVQLFNSKLTSNVDILDGFETLTINTDMQNLVGLYGELDNLENLLPSAAWQTFSIELGNIHTAYGITSQQKQKVLLGALQKALGVWFDINENGEFSLNKNTEKYEESNPYTSKINTLTTTYQYLDNFIQHIGDNIVIVKPVVVHNNAYEASDINGWDGNKIDMGNNSEYIMSPKVGAGIKNDDNTFTGIVMGRKNIYDSDSPKDSMKIGLFGQYHGVETMFLNAKNGAAIFGAAGETLLPDGQTTVGGAQIIIDPAQKNALLYSSNFYKYYGDDGLPLEYYESNETGEGMQINLSKPEIRYGNGNFSVTKDGFLTADGGGRIAGWRVNEGRLHTTNLETNNYYIKEGNLYYLNEYSTEILIADNVSMALEMDYGEDNLMTLSSGLSRVKDKYGNIIKDENGDPIHIADNDKKQGARIYSYFHNDINSEEEGFYIDKDGASWGNGLMFDKNGLIRSGQVNGDGKYFTITGNTTLGNPFISYGYEVAYGQGEYKNTLTEFPTVLGEQDYKVVDVSSQQELNTVEKDEDSLYRLSEQVQTQETTYYIRTENGELTEIPGYEAYAQVVIGRKPKSRFSQTIEINIEDWIRTYCPNDGGNYGIQLSTLTSMREYQGVVYYTSLYKYYLLSNNNVRPCTQAEYNGWVPGWNLKQSGYSEINVADQILTNDPGRVWRLKIYRDRNDYNSDYYRYFRSVVSGFQPYTTLNYTLDDLFNISPDMKLAVQVYEDGNWLLHYFKKENDAIIEISYSSNDTYTSFEDLVFDTSNNIPFDYNYETRYKIELLNSTYAYYYTRSYYGDRVEACTPTNFETLGTYTYNGIEEITAEQASSESYYQNILSGLNWGDCVGCILPNNETIYLCCFDNSYSSNGSYVVEVTEQEAKYEYNEYASQLSPFQQFQFSQTDVISQLYNGDLTNKYDKIFRIIDSEGALTDSYSGSGEPIYFVQRENSNEIIFDGWEEHQCYDLTYGNKYTLVAVENTSKIPTYAPNTAFICPKYTINTSYYTIENDSFNNISQSTFETLLNQRTSKEGTVYFGTDGISIGEHFKIANTGRDSDFLISYKLTGINDNSEEKGFYLSTDGMKIGNGFKVSDLGMLKVGNIDTENDYFTLGTIQETNAYITYGYKTELSKYNDQEYAYYPTFDGGLDGKLYQSSLTEVKADSNLEVGDLAETAYHEYHQCEYIPQSKSMPQRDGYPDIIEIGESYYRSGWDIGLTPDGLRVFNFDYINNFDSTHSLQHFHPIVQMDGNDYNANIHKIKNWNDFGKLCAYSRAVSFSLPDNIKNDIINVRNDSSKDIFDLSLETLEYFFSQYCYYFVKQNDNNNSNLKLDIATGGGRTSSGSKALTRGYVCKFKDYYYKITPNLIYLTSYYGIMTEAELAEKYRYTNEYYKIIRPTSNEELIDNNNFEDRKNNFELSTIYLNEVSGTGRQNYITISTKDKSFSNEEYRVVQLMDGITLRPQKYLSRALSDTSSLNYKILNTVNASYNDYHTVFYADETHGLLDLWEAVSTTTSRSVYSFEGSFTPTYIVYNKNIQWSAYSGYRFKKQSTTSQETYIYGFSRWGTEEGLTAEERRCSVIGALATLGSDNPAFNACAGSDLACTEEDSSYTEEIRMFLNYYPEDIKFKQLTTEQEITNTIKKVRQRSEEGLYLGKDGISIGNRFKFGLGDRENSFLISSGIEGFRTTDIDDSGVYFSKTGSRFGNRIMISDRGDLHYGQDAYQNKKNFGLLKLKCNDWTDGTGDGETAFFCSNNKMELWQWLPNDPNIPSGSPHGGHTEGWYLGTDGSQWGRNLAINNIGLMYLGRDSGAFEDGTSAVFGLNQNKTSGKWDPHNNSSFRFGKDSMTDGDEGVYYGTDGINIGTDDSHFRVWANGEADITVMNMGSGTIGSTTFGNYQENALSTLMEVKATGVNSSVFSIFVDSQTGSPNYGKASIIVGDNNSGYKYEFRTPSLVCKDKLTLESYSEDTGHYRSWIQSKGDQGFVLADKNDQEILFIRHNDDDTNDVPGTCATQINTTTGKVILGHNRNAISTQVVRGVPDESKTALRVLNDNYNQSLNEKPITILADSDGNLYLQGNLYVGGTITDNYNHPYYS